MLFRSVGLLSPSPTPPPVRAFFPLSSLVHTYGLSLVHAHTSICANQGHTSTLHRTIPVFPSLPRTCHAVKKGRPIAPCKATPDRQNPGAWFHSAGLPAAPQPLCTLRTLALRPSSKSLERIVPPTTAQHSTASQERRRAPQTLFRRRRAASSPPPPLLLLLSCSFLPCRSLYLCSFDLSFCCVTRRL